MSYISDILPYYIDNGLNSTKETITVLKHIEGVLENNIEGDIIDMGCYNGHLLYHIQLLLERHKSDKSLYGVDSFEGLPELMDCDKHNNSSLIKFEKGDMSEAHIDDINEKFKDLKKPIILKGFFNEIDLEKYPKKVSLAHFDGDLYKSIMHSFQIIYPRLSDGGVILVDDYTLPDLPGVKIATDEFLSDKVGTSYILNGKYIFIKHRNKQTI